jgi:septum formation inhibitor MinC
MIIERSLEFEVQHYEDFRNTMRSCVLDRFLGGRGTSWARYEPHVRAMQGQPVDGAQVTTDEDEPNEELDYECAPVDYVHWKDFGHTLARTWPEVRGVWRKVYMTKGALEERFGDDWAGKIPMDAQPEDYERRETSGDGEDTDRACIYEIWDKETGKAYWLSKSIKQMVDEKDDPLGLEDFFPCPRPLYASLTNDSLIPVPDFALYQDQARQLDTLADRLEGLIQALQVKGVYDAAVPEVGRIFTEGVNGTLIPVKNWQAFAEKNGLEGAIDVVDLENIYEALRACYDAIQQCLKIIYDVTGLADIIRGQSEASETATAQQIKGQYASLRLNNMKQDVALFATQLFQLKAQIYTSKFAPETVIQMAGITQLTPEDQELVPKAIELLFGPRAQDPNAEECPNPLRVFRIEVNADTMVQIDEDTEKQRRMEFLAAVGGFFDSATKIVQQAGPMGPALVPLTMTLLKFGVTGFKVGRQVEGIIDSTADKLAEMAKNPPPPQPNPDMVKVQGEQQMEQMRFQHEQQSEAAQRQFDQQKLQADMQAKAQEAAMNADVEKHKANVQAQVDQFKVQNEMDLKRELAMLDARTKIEIAEITAQATLQGEQAKAAAQAAAGEKVAEATKAAKPAEAPKAPEITIHNHIPSGNKKVVRGGDGKISGVQDAP